MTILHHSSQTHAEDRRTKSRLTPYIGICGDEVVRLISCEDAGLDEAQQRVELLQVVLDGGPRQQDSEVNWELHTHTTCRGTSSKRLIKVKKEDKVVSSRVQLSTCVKVLCRSEFWSFSLWASSTTSMLHLHLRSREERRGTRSEQHSLWWRLFRLNIWVWPHSPSQEWCISKTQL